MGVHQTALWRNEVGGEQVPLLWRLSGCWWLLYQLQTCLSRWEELYEMYTSMYTLPCIHVSSIAQMFALRQIWRNIWNDFFFFNFLTCTCFPINEGETEWVADDCVDLASPKCPAKYVLAYKGMHKIEKKTRMPRWLEKASISTWITKLNVKCKILHNF